MNRIINNIEFNFLLFGFMTNFVWEMLQMPFFKFSAEISASAINLACLQASIGDALILIIMFWFTAMLLKSRKWIFHLTVYRIGLFLLPGIGITIAFEYLTTRSLDHWVYSDLMPTLPFIGTCFMAVITSVITHLFTYQESC